MATKKTKQFEYTISNGEVVLKKYIFGPQTKKVEIPANIDGKPVVTVDVSMFDNLNYSYRELVIDEGVKNIKNANRLFSGIWKKIIFPKSIEHIGLRESESCPSTDCVCIAPKKSYAESFVKKLKDYLDCFLIVENEDIDLSSERMVELRAFRYSNIDQYQDDKKLTNRFAAVLDSYPDNKIEEVVVPSVVNGKALRNVVFQKISSKTKRIIIPETITYISGLDRMFGDSAENLDELIVSPKNSVYWSDGLALFSKDKKTLIRFISHAVKEYSIPNGTQIISEYAFEDVSNLISILIPKSVTTIGKYAFNNCENLKTLYGLENVKKVGYSIINRCNLNQIVLVDGESIQMVRSANKVIECKETSKRTIKVPDGITEIGERAFNAKSVANDKLEEVILPDSVKSIGDYAFDNRTKLKKINIPDSVKNIGEGAFDRCNKLETISIPPNTKEIYIHNLGALKSLFIPATVKKINFKIPYFSFVKNEIDYIEVDSKNENFSSSDGILYSKDGKQALYLPSALKVDVLEIPDGVEEIHDYFCRNNKNIKKVIFPKSLKKIGVEAFLDSNNIKEIVFKDGIKLKRIEEHAFTYTGLKEVSIPEGVEFIGEEAFAHTKIKKAILPKSVKEIGDAIFTGPDEVVIYDTIDPNARDAYEKIDTINGDPNSRVGYIGIKLRPMYVRDCAANQYWQDYTITVKSAKTDEIKYKVWMGADNSDRNYYCLLSSAWGKNGSFAFKKLDKAFKNIKGADHKLKVCEFRLRYPFDLSKAYQEEYIKYYKRFGDEPEKLLNEITKIEKTEEINPNLKYVEQKCTKKVFKRFLSECENAQKIFNEYYLTIKDMDISKISKADEYYSKLEKKAEDVREKLNDKYPYKLYDDYFPGVEFRLDCWLDSIDCIFDNRFKEFSTVVFKRKIMKKSFKANDVHKRVCSALKKSVDDLNNNLIDRAKELISDGHILYENDSIEYLKKVISIDNKKGLVLVRTDEDDVKKAIKNTGVGDEFILEINGFNKLSVHDWVGVKTKDGYIGYIDEYDGCRFYASFIKDGKFKFTGKVVQVNPLDDYVKINLDVSKV